jgi:hypothetical protein
MESAFERAGRTQAGNELMTACAKYFNDSRWSLEEFDAVTSQARAKMAEKGQIHSAQQGHITGADLRHPMPSEGHTTGADTGQRFIADARQPIPDEGQRLCVHKDPLALADIRNPTPGEGQSESVHQDHGANASAGQPVASRKGHSHGGHQALGKVAAPAREPSAADIEALKESGDFSYFQMINLRKKAWSTYRYGQLKNVRSLNMQENLVINDVIDWGRKNKVKEDNLVSLTMPASEMKKIIQHAKNAIPSKAEVISKTAKRTASHGR